MLTGCGWQKIQSRPILPPPSRPASGLRPQHTMLQCDTMISGTDCAQAIRLPASLVALDVSGLSALAVSHLCKIGYSDKWSDNHGQTPSVFSEFMCPKGFSEQPYGPDFRSPGGYMRGDFYFPDSPGLWVITWQLLNRSGQVVSSATYKVQLLS